MTHTTSEEQELHLLDEAKQLFSAQRTLQLMDKPGESHQASQTLDSILVHQTSDKTKKLTRWISYIVLIPTTSLGMSLTIGANSSNLFLLYSLIIYVTVCLRILLDLAWYCVSSLEQYWSTRFRITMLVYEFYHRKFGKYPDAKHIQFMPSLHQSLQEKVLWIVGLATLISIALSALLPVLWAYARYIPTDIEILQAASVFLLAFALFSLHATTLMYHFTGKYIKRSKAAIADIA